MADTKKVLVRLVRNFPAGVTHRRGGVELTAGPSPVEAEVTKEQLEAIEGDANIEIVSKSEAEKWAKYTEDAPAHPSASELAESDQPAGRNYEGSTETVTTGSSTDVTVDGSSKKSGKKG